MHITTDGWNLLEYDERVISQVQYILQNENHRQSYLVIKQENFEI